MGDTHKVDQSRQEEEIQDPLALLWSVYYNCNNNGNTLLAERNLFLKARCGSRKEYPTIG